MFVILKKLILSRLRIPVTQLILQWDLSRATASIRIKLASYAFSILFLLIIIRLIVVANTNFVHNIIPHNTQYGSSLYRANIADRNNNLLAVNVPIASLYVNPHKVIDVESSINKLVKAIPELDILTLRAKIKSNKKFIWIKRDITPQEHETIYNLGLPGFGFEKEQKRIYIYGNLLSHIIGYVSRDMVGLAGLEKYFNNSLTQRQINGQGDIEKLNKTLELSLDVRIQNILSEEIDKTLKKFHAKGAAGIVVNPNNGEVLAVVSKPDFDPHIPSQFSSNHLFNMATQGVYELGSGMKSLTIAIGLDIESTTIYDAYDLSYMKVKGFQVRDYHKMKGWHSVPHIFLKSSNIGVGQIMLEIGKHNFIEYLRKLGALTRLDLEVPECARPLFPPFTKWTDLSLITMSYGYGISESPMHFMQAMLPIVNGGVLYPLTLVKRDKLKPLLGKRIFKNTTSLNMQKLLRLVVSHGTGSKAEVPGYYIGGKTGTANIQQNGKYDPKKRLSSFFGILPATNPQYMVYVIFNQPKGLKETHGFAGGGWVAAPTVSAIFKRIISLDGIEKLNPNSKEVHELQNIQYKIHKNT